MVESLYPAYRLSFRLPATLAFAVRPGVHHPCLAGTILTVAPGDLVTVDGKSRERVFDQTIKFLRTITKQHPSASFPATLISPDRRRDRWTVIIGADVALAPCSIEPHLPPKVA